MTEDIEGLEDVWQRRHGERTLPVRMMVVAWHKSQDGLVHWVEKVVEKTLVKFTSGPREGDLFYTTQHNTLCGWVVYSLPEDNKPHRMPPAVVTCFECIVKDVAHV